MQNINPLTILRSLKGAPLSCLMALMFATKPVGKEWLSRITGYSDKPVAAALDYLLEMGFVTTSGRYESWQIKQNVFQLPLGPENPLPESSRNNSDSLPTTTAINIDSNKIDKKAVEVVKEEPEYYNPNFEECHHILKSAGIGEPMASRLVNIEHATPYYLLAHVLYAKKKKMDTGLLIHRIKSKDPAPDLNVNFHLLKCSCFECFNLAYFPDKGYLPPEEFVFDDYLESLQPVESIL
jgi:hypothetical protein